MVWSNRIAQSDGALEVKGGGSLQGIVLVAVEYSTDSRSVCNRIVDLNIVC